MTIKPGDGVVFWRPGCSFCAALRQELGDDPRLTWINVWEDDTASARVRSVNDGNELVPTVIVGGADGEQVLRNPSGPQVRAALS